MVGHAVAGVEEGIVFGGIADVPVGAEDDVGIGVEGLDDFFNLGRAIFCAMFALVPVEVGGDELHGLAADDDVGREVVAGLCGLGEARRLAHTQGKAVGEDGVAVVVPLGTDDGVGVAGKDFVAGGEEHLPVGIADELGTVFDDGHDVGTDGVDETAVGEGFVRRIVESDAAVGGLAQREVAAYSRKICKKL